MKKLLGLFGWLGVGLVVAAVVIRFTKPEWQTWSHNLALAGLVVTAIYALSQWRDIGRSFGARNVRYGSMAVGSVVLFLGLLVAINYIGSRQNKRWDLTAAKQFSLSDQTKKILTDLKKPVVVRVFFDSSPDSTATKQDLQDRLSGYEYASKQVSLEFVDAVREPVQAKQYDVQAVPTTLFEYDGRTERTTGRDEQDFTNALKKVIEGKAKKIYFLQGHGEKDIASSDRQSGFSGALDALKTDNFDTAKLLLAQEGKVPADATAIVSAGARSDYSPAEMDAVRDYLAHGGKLLLMIDPPDKADSAPLTSLIALAKDWGMDVGTDMVIDASGMGRLVGANSPAVPVAMPAQPSHPITDRFEEYTAFPIARSVTPIAGGANGHTAQKLLETSPKSWAETDLKGLFANKQPEPNLDKGDKQGPISIAAAVSAPVADAAPGAAPDAPKPESRLVVVGDSDFAANGALGAAGNRELFQNMANWLAQQENLIAIHPRDPDDRRIQITEDQNQRIFWLTILIVPALLFGNGFRVWWKRR